MTRWIFATLAAAGMAIAGGAKAAECDPGKGAGDLTLEEAKAVWECLKEDLYAGYNQGDTRWIPAEYVENYRDWTPVSALPAAPGFHGGRFLLTYVNDVGDEAYLQYAEDPDIPVGTLIAKESFQVTDAGEVKKGPLFIMQKVEESTSPETMGWYYMMVAPNGAPQAVNVMTACNECHVGNFAHQGGLGYPVQEARVPAE